MTPKENLLSLLHRNGYRTAPVYFELCPSLTEKFKLVARDHNMPDATPEEYFGTEFFPFADVPGPKCAERGEIDWRQYFPDGIKPDAFFDHDYGIGHEPGSEAAMHMTYMRHPMALFDSLEQMQAYPWPDWKNSDPSAAKSLVDTIHARGKAAKGFMQMTVWEIAWYLRGMENLMADMMEDDPKAAYLFDMVTERACQWARYYAMAGTDVLFLGDDVGMQHTIMMSPELYRTWIRPRLRQVVDAAKAVNPDIVIDYHSCGFVTPLIDDLIQSGIEVLNPVQPECMDFKEIHAAYGDRLSFRGVIGTQTTMPFGTPAEVKKAVWHNLDIAGPKGGLFAMPTHLLEPEVPWDNIEAYVAACKEYASAGV